MPVPPMIIDDLGSGSASFSRVIVYSSLGNPMVSKQLMPMMTGFSSMVVNKTIAGGTSKGL
jgi:hypothetical protein